MKKLFIALPIIASLGACTANEQTAAGTTLGGAALGAAVAGNGNRREGAAIGAVAGLATGVLVNNRRTSSGNCVYQRPDGSRYTAACP